MSWGKWSSYGSSYPGVSFGQQAEESLVPQVTAAAAPAAGAATSAAGAGATAGAAGGPLGAALGAGIGGLISLVGGLFGASAAKQRQIRDAKVGAAKDEATNKLNAVERGTQHSQDSFGNLIGVYRNAMLGS